MDKIAAGVVRFQTEEFPKRKELFEQLVKGQSPRALFIGCSDSRVDPNLITQTEPGELFICRNAGNIVPPHSNHTGSMTASIEYAVGALNVPHVIICGHSACGAMSGVLQPQSVGDLPHVADWLGYVRAAALTMEAKGADLSPKDKLDLLIRENVVLQLIRLRTHPLVAARLAAGKLELHGWVYDIQGGGVQVWDDARGTFLPAAERYRERLERVARDAEPRA